MVTRITLVTPCKNAASTIARTLDSIEAQKYGNLEYVVQDGDSNDGTLSIVERYKTLRPIIRSEPDAGVANALNKGFSGATGEIRCYLNADDCLAPGALRSVASFFDDHPEIDVVTGACKRIYADGTSQVTHVPGRYVSAMSLRNDIEQPSTFWRASAHERAGEFDESFKLAFDWEWWNRLRSTGARFSAVGNQLSIYYFSDDNLTSKAGRAAVDEMYRVTRMYGPLRGRSAYIYKLLFYIFDMRGFYDVPFADLSPSRKVLFGAALRGLCIIFGEDIVYNYNWNWASRQLRGIKWY